MTDELDNLVGEAASGGDATGDAAEALLSPELLEQVRNSGKGRQPPKAVRPAEPATSDDEVDDDEVDEDEPAPRPRSRSKYARYRKHEVEAEAERLAQENEELRRAAEARKQTVDPNAVRDLAFTIEFAARLGFGTAAALRGPHWQITDPEVQRIGETGSIALAPLAEEYAHLLPWINFAAALGAPIGVRVAEDRRISALREVSREEEAT